VRLSQNGKQKEKKRRKGTDRENKSYREQKRGQEIETAERRIAVSSKWKQIRNERCKRERESNQKR
jgi:hypothetical protein